MPRKNHLLCAIAAVLFGSAVFAQTETYPPAAQVAADFHRILDRPRVPFNASFQTTQTDSVIIEHGYIYSEANEKVPMLIYKPVSAQAKLPAVIFLHGTGGKKDEARIKNILYRLTKLGIAGVAIDARFHGERIAGGAHGSEEYIAAVTQAWENSDKSHQTHPFLWDTSYDLWRVTDYLCTRPDIDANRLGMGGISMGGIETWMAASVDPRIKVAVPDIAIQSFKWSLENDRWQGRVGTIKGAHQQAAKDMGDSTINQRNIKAVWDKILPGITGEFDCPSMIRLFAPRPFLILSTENDNNNPLPGAKIAFAAVQAAYGTANADKLKIDVAPKLGHTTPEYHIQMALDWFEQWLVKK
ncbi:alpha/beta hydrolase family protein [Mucilaginibacter sp. AW1-3]